MGFTPISADDMGVTVADESGQQFRIARTELGGLMARRFAAPAGPHETMALSEGGMAPEEQPPAAPVAPAAVPSAPASTEETVPAAAGGELPAKPVDLSEWAIPQRAPAAAGVFPTARTTVASKTALARPELASVEAGFGKATAAGEVAAQKAEEAGRLKVAAEVGAARESYQQYARMAAQEQDRQVRMRAKMEGFEHEIDGKLREMEAMRVEPNRLFNRADTAAQVMAGIGIGLGAIGGALMKTGTNPALDVINRAIDRDLEAQRINIENRRAGVVGRLNLYGELLSRFKDETAARAVAREVMLKSVDLKLQSVLGQARTAEVESQANKMRADIAAAVTRERATALAALGQRVEVDSQVQQMDPLKIREQITNEVQRNPALKDYFEVRGAKQDVDAALRTNNPGMAILSIINRGMTHARFGKEMMDILDYRGKMEQAGDWLKKQASGGNATNLVQNLRRYIAMKEVQLRDQYGPQFDRLDRMSRAVGEPEGLRAFYPVGTTPTPGSWTEGRKPRTTR